MAKSQRNQKVLPAQQTPGLGVQVVYDIPLVADLNRITLALSGTVAIGTASATGLYKDGICELIKSVELKRDGSDTLVSVPFSLLVQGNMFRRRKQAAPTLTQPGLTVATQPFAAIGVLDLNAFGALRPKDSALRETDCKTLQLIVTFASDFTGVFNLGSAVVGSSTISLIAKADETVELADPATGAKTKPRLKVLVSNREDNVTGATSRQRFRLTPGQALRGITLRAVNSSSVTSDSVLSAVRVYVGDKLRTDLTAAAIRAMNQAEFNASIPTGYYYLDFAELGQSDDRLEDCYDLRAEVLQGADAYIEYDSSAQMTLGVTQFGYKKAA